MTRLRKNSRKQSVCHPERLNHALGLCVRCYKKVRRERGGPAIERERAAERAYHKRWQARDPERARLSHAAAGARWRVRNSEHLYRYHLKRKYGLTIRKLRLMQLAQRGCCGICSKPFDGKPNVDHDHKTGATRGLLCTRCNHLLGNADDSRHRLKQAIEYLTRWRNA